MSDESKTSYKIPIIVALITAFATISTALINNYFNKKKDIKQITESTNAKGNTKKIESPNDIFFGEWLPSELRHEIGRASCRERV